MLQLTCFNCRILQLLSVFGDREQRSWIYFGKTSFFLLWLALLLCGCCPITWSLPKGSFESRNQFLWLRSFISYRGQEIVCFSSSLTFYLHMYEEAYCHGGLIKSHFLLFQNGWIHSSSKQNVLKKKRCVTIDCTYCKLLPWEQITNTIISRIKWVYRNAGLINVEDMCWLDYSIIIKENEKRKRSKFNRLWITTLR